MNTTLTKRKTNHQTRIALWKGSSRTENLMNALGLVMDGIDWSSRHSVVIKPNLVQMNKPNAVTHPDALKALLILVRERYFGQLIIAEGCAVEPTPEFFKLQGFDELATQYDATLLDLNEDESVPVNIYDRHEKAIQVRMARSIIESDCRISLCLPKTHNVVPVTLSIKNIVMGSLQNRALVQGESHQNWLRRMSQAFVNHDTGGLNHKIMMHQGYAWMNINLARLASYVLPHLSIVDGFIGMEGKGPTDGKAVDWGIAIAGTDPLAVDTFTSRLMGFSIDNIGYLKYCARLNLGCVDLEQIEVVGNVTARDVSRTFMPHPQYSKQLHWQHQHADAYLIN